MKRIRPAEDAQKSRRFLASLEAKLPEDLKMIGFLKKHYYIDDREANFMIQFIEDLLFAERKIRCPRADYPYA